LNQDELLAHVEREEANCIVHYTSLLSEQRRKAMQYYYGQPYGNEVEGRSQVVTTEVKDAVEGILPSLMAIFTSTDEIVRFEAQRPEDEALAQQATDYINYIFSRLNNGFLALYCLFKDALLQKNGYVKVYWEDYQEQSKETYQDLDDNQFASLMSDEELELLEHTEKPDEQAMQQIQMQARQLQAQGVQKQLLDAKIAQLPVAKLHDALFRRTARHKGVCIDPLPPEEVLISRETPNELTKARFVEHRTLKTLSEIREMGFTVPDDIADYAPNADFNLERVERLKFDDALAYRQDSDNADPSTKRVWFCEAYVKVDYDGDGIAELRKVSKIGKTIFDNEEFDSLPVIGGTAIVMPHKHYGLSIHDLVGDIQLQSSTLLRNIFDNTYLANNERKVVLEGMVNMSDLLTSRPGGIIRVKAMGAVQPLPTQVLGPPAYGLLEYLSKVKQNRVGVTDFPNAVDPDAINAKAAFVDNYKSAALERINLMARILAEGPVKEIFWKILELVSKHQDKPQMVKLRGTWIPVDPREWKNRFNMTVTVGLGTGSQQTILQGAMGIMEIQKGMLAAGLGNRTVTEKNIYHAAHRYAKAVFPKDADAMFNDPTSLPPPQPQPNPELLKLQLQQEKQQMSAQQKDHKLMVDSALEQMRQKLEADIVKFQEMAQNMRQTNDSNVDIAKHVLELASEQQNLLTEKLTDLRLGREEHAADGENILLQGKVNSLLESQKAIHKHLQMVHEAILAPRETEVAARDEKGKIKRTVSKVLEQARSGPVGSDGALR